MAISNNGSSRVKKATRADVAKLAGVSESTVSYVLTGARPISDDTKERVEAAMAELGYTPNAMAQALARRQAGLLALLFPIRERGFNASDFDYVEAATKVTADQGYQLLMWPNAVEDTDSLNKIASQGLVDGVILMEVREKDPRVETLRKAKIPFVLIGRTNDCDNLTYVDADFALWGPMALEHLASLGHKNIGMISAQPDLFNAGYGPGVKTEASVIAAAKTLGMTVLIKHVNSSMRAGYAALEELYHEMPGMTALLGLNEPAVIGALEAASAKGIHIPENLSVLTFGISEEAATMTMPAQSSLGVDGDALGTMAAEFLLARLGGDDRTTLQHLAPPLMVDRGSTGPARGSA